MDDHPLTKTGADREPIHTPYEVGQDADPANLVGRIGILPHGPMWRRVLLLAWPVLLQQWLVLCVPLFDTYLAGSGSLLEGNAQTASQAARPTAGYLVWFLPNHFRPNSVV